MARIPWSDERAELHGEMLSAVSHDLKTPLASIIGSLQIYQQLANTLPEDRKQALIRTALEEAYRLDSLMTGVLDMMRLETGLTVPKRTDTDAVTLTQQAISGAEQRYPERKIFLQISGDAREVAVDRQLTSRVIGHLLDNALKYSRGDIRMTLGFTEAEFTVQVEDSGPGIPEEQKERAFEKYARLPQQTGNDPVFGLGLGLAISRLIARLQGGDVTLEDRPEGGSSFTLRLPLN